MEQKYSPLVRWLLYIVSFMSTLVGVIVGVILMTQDDQESRDVGKNCIIAAVVGLVFWCLCSVVMFFFSFVLSLAAASSALLLPVV